MGKNKKQKKAEEVVEEQVFSCDDGSCDCGCDSECDCGCDCHEHSCCCSCGHEDEGFVRRYYTKAEKVIMLEEYLAQLKAEVAGVEEELAELKK